MSKYPWAVLLFNRLQLSCLPLGKAMTMKLQYFEENENFIEFDICGGTLITKKHILTTAECVAKNRYKSSVKGTPSIVSQYNAMQNTPHGSAFPATKIEVEYSKPCNIFALMGYTNRNKAKENDEELAQMQKITTYTDEHNYSFSKGYNYNLGSIVNVLDIYNIYDDRVMSL